MLWLPASDLARLFRHAQHPPLRGILLSIDDRRHVLYTRGVSRSTAPTPACTSRPRSHSAALPRLGAEYVPDFVVARLDNGGLHWTLVELESPRAGLFTRQGRKTRQLDAGTRQVSDWRDWIAANRDYAQRPKADGGLGLPEIDHSARGLVIIGRRSAVTDDDRRRLKSVTFNERVNVHSTTGSSMRRPSGSSTPLSWHETG